MDFKCCAKNTTEQKDISQTYGFLKTIADKNRLRIICLLRAQPKCVCEIFPALGISQKLASHHLSQLKKQGLVKKERQGNFIYYSLDKEALKLHKKIFNQMIK